MPIIFRKTQTGRIENTNNVKEVEPLSPEAQENLSKSNELVAKIDMHALEDRIAEIDQENSIKAQRARVAEAMRRLERELSRLDDLEPQKDEEGNEIGHKAIVYSDGRGHITSGAKLCANWLVNYYGDGTRKLQWYD